MQLETFSYDLSSKAWSVPVLPPLDSPQTMVLAFGAPELVAHPNIFQILRQAYPNSHVIGCSSAGEIAGSEVRDKTLSVAVARFEHTTLDSTAVLVRDASSSHAAGQVLARKLYRPGLRALLVLSEGLKINGSELVRGINSVVDDQVVVTGGLAGDGTRFERTWVCCGNRMQSGLVAAVALYGEHLIVGHGSKGGWDKFGPERVVTRSDGNVLYELDGKAALDLYKQYLGEKAAELPASALLFPLALRASATDDKFLVRTVLAVSSEQKSLTFAGDMPEGYLAQLMKADFERLVGGAADAASAAQELAHALKRHDAGVLGIAISCVGRRIVLGDRIEEELEAVADILPPSARTTGFYSYGEISPYSTGHCDLHNQTMTITVLGESPTPVPVYRGTPAAVHAPPAPVLRGKPAAVHAPPALPPSTAAVSATAGAASAAAGAASAAASVPSASPLSQAAVEPAEGFVVTGFVYDLERRAWSVDELPRLDSPHTLITVFGAPEARDAPEVLEQLARAYPTSHIIGCSSAGEIVGTEVRDKTLSVAVARFEHTFLSSTAVMVSGPSGSYQAGQMLARKLQRPDLRALLVVSEGLAINGSELVRGLGDVVGDSVVVTGGLAGDGTRFQETWIFGGGRLRKNTVAAVGFYGEHVIVGHGSKGGWDKFGPERVITRSDGNVLYELDGKPALELYKTYLGDKAAELPAAGLRFPLALKAMPEDGKLLVRTVLAVDEQQKSMTFAGDVPQGARVQLMKADLERLVGGAAGAAIMAKETARELVPGVLGSRSQERGQRMHALGIAISCVGRRLVLGDRVEEELEAVRELLGGSVYTAGFYSYGELSPYAKTGRCDLHNQTMTLTLLGESPVPVSYATSPRARARTRPGVNALSMAPTARSMEAMSAPSELSELEPVPGSQPAWQSPGQPSGEGADSDSTPVPVAMSAAAVPSAAPSGPVLGVQGALGTGNALPRGLGGRGSGPLAQPPRRSSRPRTSDLMPAGHSFEMATFTYDLKAHAWSVDELPALDSPRTLVLAFGASALADHPAVFEELRKHYPSSHIIGCSTAGEIAGDEVLDGVLSVAVTRFAHTELVTAQVVVGDAAGSFPAGQVLAHKLNEPGLRGIIVLAEGVDVSGSELLRGINSVIDESVVVLGGLAGDGIRFQRTWVLTGDKVQGGLVTAVGLYGEHVLITHGAQGGWDRLGPELEVTRATGNTVLEFDDQPALPLYRQHLGEHAAGLPATGLLFPLALRERPGGDGDGTGKLLLRMLLGVDESSQSLTVAGDVPEGARVLLMKASFDRLVAGAGTAGQLSWQALHEDMGAHALSLAVSCVGRRVVLGDRSDAEVRAVLAEMAPGVHSVGFYSYGAIAPFAAGHSDFHNQTMIVAVISESATPVTMPTSAALGRHVQEIAAAADFATATGMPVASDPGTGEAQVPQPALPESRAILDQERSSKRSRDGQAQAVSERGQELATESRAVPASRRLFPAIPVVLALGMVIAFAAGLAVSRIRSLSARESTRETAQNAAPAPAASLELPPAWADRPFVVHGEDVFLVGQGSLASGTSVEAAVDQARAQAILHLLDNLVPELMGAPLYDYVRGQGLYGPNGRDGALASLSAQAVQSVAARFLAQAGRSILLERMDAHAVPGRSLLVRFRMPAGQFRELVAHYRQSATVAGVTVAPLFPAIAALGAQEGEILVVRVEPASPGARAGLQPGDVVLKVDDRYVGDVAAYGRMIEQTWRTLSQGQHLRVVLDAAGQPIVTVEKPAP